MKDGLQKLLNLCPTNFGYPGRKIEISMVCNSTIDEFNPYQSDFITYWCEIPGIKCDWWKVYILSLCDYIVHTHGGYIKSDHDLNDIIGSYTPVAAYCKVYDSLRYGESDTHYVHVTDCIKTEFMKAVRHYLKTYSKVIKYISRC